MGMDLGAIVGFDDTSGVNPLLGEATDETTAYAQLAKAEDAEQAKQKESGSSLLGNLKQGLSGAGKSAGKAAGGLSL